MCACLMQVLYTEGSEVHLMDDNTYEQIQVGSGFSKSGHVDGSIDPRQRFGFRIDPDLRLSCYIQICIGLIDSGSAAGLADQGGWAPEEVC